MIRANEIRLGNKLSYTEDGRSICTVFAVEGNEIGVEDLESPTWENESNLYPIPLTTEVLSRCLLFGKNNKDYPYKLFKGSLRMRNGQYFWKYHMMVIELPYLHDLQNLYYILSNKRELEINL